MRSVQASCTLLWALLLALATGCDGEAFGLGPLGLDGGATLLPVDGGGPVPVIPPALDGGMPTPAEDAGQTVDAGIIRQPKFTCDPALAPPATPLRRLTRSQLSNALTGLLQRFAPTNAGAIATALEGPLSRLPKDLPAGAVSPKGGFAQFDQSVQQEHADALDAVGTALGMEFTSTAARRTEIFKGCATNASTTDDDACLDDFIRTFGARALRRPLTADEVQFFRSAKRPTDTSAVAPAVLADAVNLIIQSPEFFYAVELGQPSAPSALDAFELAHKLALHFWQSLPDDALWAAAANGELLTEAAYRSQVERLASSAKAQAALDDFFSHWLQLDAVPALDTLLGTPKFAAYAGADLPGPNTRQAVVNDVLAAARYEFARQGSLSDLLNNRRSFATDPLLARIYGTPVWDGVAAPALFGSTARAGLIARAAFVMTGAPKTRPIIKGATLRQALLCEALPVPPASATSVQIEPGADATTRERVELLTESPGSACAGCHVSRINPLGFATENFDGLGRERTVETVFDDTGKKLADRPIRTDSVPRVLSGDPTPSTGAGDLSRLLDQSGSVHSCFARMSFRFTFGRAESAGDGCGVSRLEKLALEGRPLAELWREVGFLDQFKKRSVP